MLPTEAENFSLAVLEALAAGCPVLSTLCKGNDEVLVADDNAMIHAVGDIDGMASALQTLLNDPALRKRLSTNARNTAAGYSAGPNERIAIWRSMRDNETCLDTRFRS